MTTLRSILLAATALATLAPPAHAASEMLRETTVESWQIQSWSRNDGPGFSFCTAHTAFETPSGAPWSAKTVIRARERLI
jgi:hypothetical protein